MDSVSIKWEEPPASQRGRGSVKWGEIAAALREHPGRWALVAENVALGAQTYLRNRYGLETKSRVAGLGYKKNYGDIYARYVGDSVE